MTSSVVQYARSGDVDIAWTISGDGPLDIVYVPGFISHLDLCREVPAFAIVLARLERFARVLTFDKRGTGLSGRDLGFGSLAERADDIEAVMDAAGWNSAHLVGVSEGGPLSVLFAATHPARVESLALYGTYACVLPPDDPDSAKIDLAKALERVEKNWGTGAILQNFLHAPAEPSVTDLLARYERASASPRLASEITRSNLTIDARPFLPAVTAPALVIHREGDHLVPARRGRELAEGLPGARYVELPGRMHCAWTAVEWAPALDVLEEFLTGESPVAAPAERTLATVMFTDIVSSTASAAEIGDRAWRDLLDRHDSESKRLVERFAGRVVKQTGDGTMAIFDGPARAVHCARRLVEVLAISGIRLRVGLHTGEIELRNDDIGGIAVHIAARVAALAGSGEVLVSRTVHDLVVGSDLRLDAHGTYELKGVPGEWQVFRAR